MVTTNPPMAKISMIGIWVETVLYGVNCVMYALSMLILLRTSRDKIPTLRWVLVVMSTILILLATAYVGASLQQLLDAFVYAPADVPDYSTIYWLNYHTTLRSLKNMLYDTLVYAQDIIVIWRLYVVFMYNWRVIVFPIILEAASMATVISERPSVGQYGSVVPSLAISAWVLSITLNVFVTMAIAGRLWWMGQRTASLTSSRTNRYAFSVYAVIESGAIFSGANIIAVILYVLNNPGYATGVDVTSQLATLTPLLIVVQVGLTGQHRLSTNNNRSRTVPTAQYEITFPMVFSRESQDSQRHLSLQSTLKHPHSVPNSSAHTVV
ncbi:hypothetical protein HD554DRAFT_310409 [Boletus coccyginus]|nr:hypothetical protein HD554DRAFT_310409 [Boletus coccyginus]